MLTLTRIKQAEQLSLLDAEPDLLEAFASFDPKGRGVINPQELRKCLGSEGDAMSEEEVSFRGWFGLEFGAELGRCES